MHDLLIIFSNGETLLTNTRYWDILGWTLDWKDEYDGIFLVNAFCFLKA